MDGIYLYSIHYFQRRKNSVTAKVNFGCSDLDKKYRDLELLKEHGSDDDRIFLNDFYENRKKV
jgi:hypothetical protein